MIKNLFFFLKKNFWGNLIFGKKWKTYIHYKSLIDALKPELLEIFKVRVDNIYRLYTVINIPPEFYEKFGPVVGNQSVEIWLKNFNNFCWRKNLMELISVERIRKEDDYNYLIIIEYKLLNMKFVNRLLNTIIYFLIPSILITLSTLFIFSI